MAKQIFTKPTILIILFIVTSFRFLDDDTKDKMLIKILNQTLQTAHFSQVDLNDQFSEKVFKMYIGQLDYSKRFFLSSDIELLKKYEYQIDDEIKNESLDFFKLSIETLKKRTTEIESIYKEILDKPFDFTVNESVELDEEKRTFPTSKEEQYEAWRLILKYAVIDKIDLKITENEKAKEKNDTSVKIKTFEEIEIEARASVLKTYNEWFVRINQISDQDRFAYFLNSITYSYDPHTEFLPPEEKENFDISLSGKFEGIGATLQQQDGYIKVINIVPGSASWRQGDLEVNDIILKVSQETGEPVNVVDMPLDEAVKLIRGTKGTVVKLSVKKIDGSFLDIPITRDVVVLEETYAKSIILKDKDSSRIGYIYLPKFYVDFEDKNGRHCSEDIKKELIKLKEENVDGIIFDLRNNGGGSLQDVVDMAGLFIEKGPIVQVKGRYGNASLYNDNDKDIYYDGNLVVLVNVFSASASEIFAAAIQDYDRGIVMGSTSSFGKGTVQRFIDFDQLIIGNNEYKPFGVIKITTHKFYRINGGTTQLKGVIPDIILPDSYTYLESGEKEMENALEYDEIEKAKYDLWEPDYKLEKVVKKSNSRISDNEYFKLQDENAKRLKIDTENSLVSLNLIEYQKYKKDIEDKAAKLKEISKIENGLDFSILKEDLQAIGTDTAKLASYENWEKSLKKDNYLEEAVNVIKDMKK